MNIIILIIDLLVKNVLILNILFCLKKLRQILNHLESDVRINATCVNTSNLATKKDFVALKAEVEN